MESGIEVTPLSVILTTWRSYFVSERIDPKGVDVTKDSIDEVFKGGVIIIDNSNITVDGVCKYECSKESIFTLECWRMEYNHERTHSSLNNLTPAEFIRSLRKDEDL